LRIRIIQADLDRPVSRHSKLYRMVFRLFPQKRKRPFKGFGEGIRLDVLESLMRSSSFRK